MAWPVAALPWRVSWDYGEGWNAYWAARAMAGAPLYTDRVSAITNNYPPLSFYVVGVVGRLVGDQIIGGRIVSLVSLVACAAMVGTMIARLGGGRNWGAAGAGAFLLYAASFAWRYVASDDPQWLAAAFTLAALQVLTWRPDRPAAWRLASACALLVVGGLIKHNQLAAPAAITLWLAVGDRRGLAVWLASAALLVTAAVAFLHAAFGPALFDQVIHHQRVFKARYAVNALGTLSGLLPEIALGAILWRIERRRRPDRRVRLLLAFAWIALALGIVERLGTGVSVNAHFDSALGFMIVAGVSLGRSDVLPPAVRRRMAAIALAPLALATLVMLPQTIGRFADREASRAKWKEVIATLRATRDPVACELPALCYWAGKPFLVDFYNYGQKLRTEGDPAHLREALDARALTLMVVVHDRRFHAGDGRLPEAYDHAIAANYHAVAVLPDNALLLERNRTL